MQTIRLTLVAAFAACSAVAQRTEAAPAPRPVSPPADSLRVAVTAKVGGVTHPRLDQDGKDTGSKRWSKRELQWRIGERVFTEQVEVEKELLRIARDPAFLRVPPDAPDTKELLPLVLEAEPDVRWCEILRVWDAANNAGFAEWRLAGVDTFWFMPKSVDEPVRDGGATIVPCAVFNQPDDGPEPGRTEVYVRQNGDLVIGDRVVFTSRVGQKEDLQQLRETLRQIRAAMEQDGHVGARPVDQRRGINLPVLVVADMWCEWRDVRRLLACLTEPEVGFWKLEVAVADFDLEARMAGEPDKRRRGEGR